MRQTVSESAVDCQGEARVERPEGPLDSDL